MHRFSRKWFRGWAAMALFAMLAVLTSPALAFACCCHVPNVAAVPIADAPSHPGCQGHEGVSLAPAVIEATTNPGSYPVASAMVGRAHLQNVCECAHSDGNVMALSEAPNTSAFSPLVVGTASKPSSLDRSLPSSVRFAFASNAARPRSPSAAHRTGRAPPAFSL